MNRLFILLLLLCSVAGCTKFKKPDKRVPVAKVNDIVLYYDQIPMHITRGASASDSAAIIQNYINKWAKSEFVYQKARENLSPEIKATIERQIDETRGDLIIYEYQRQMMLEKMDTIVTDQEIEDYYNLNSNSFVLGSNIVKALFIKLPPETPDIYRIKLLARSNNQADLQELESYCFQFAEKFDDFGENWITLDRLSAELGGRIDDQENFLRRYSFYETKDSLSVYLLNIRDYRLRSSIAPFDYIKDDIKRILLNNRRFVFIQSLENGIYNEALKANKFKVF
ncbi:MAG: hypothetical protein R6W81_05970 [Bacteroidales bacterium]